MVVKLVAGLGSLLLLRSVIVGPPLTVVLGETPVEPGISTARRKRHLREQEGVTADRRPRGVTGSEPACGGWKADARRLTERVVPT